MHLLEVADDVTDFLGGGSELVLEMLHVSLTLLQALVLLPLDHLLSFGKTLDGSLFLSKLHLINGLLNNDLLLVKDVEVVSNALALG